MRSSNWAVIWRRAVAMISVSCWSSVMPIWELPFPAVDAPIMPQVQTGERFVRVRSFDRFQDRGAY